MPDAPAAMWHCNTCGLVYFGFGGDTHGHDSPSVDRAANGVVQMPANSSPPDSMPGDATPRFIATDNYQGRERRRQTRYEVAVPIVAVPLASDFHIAGDAVRMTTRNISRVGIALSYTRFTNAPYFALDFTPAGMDVVQVLVKVLRVTPTPPTYEVAGTLINQLVHQSVNG
jgi:hypothetical protein